MKRIINLEFSLFHTQLNKIALQRSEEARVVCRADVCALNSEMFVFIDESGFVSVQFLLDLLGLRTISAITEVLFYNYAGKADFRKGYKKSKKKIGGNQSFFRDN